jgi:GTPase
MLVTPAPLALQILSDPAFKGQWRIAGSKIERTARMTNWDYYEAVARFQRIMDAMGVNKALCDAGAVKGDMIMIDEFDFDFSGDEKAGSLLQQYLQNQSM